MGMSKKIAVSEPEPPLMVVIAWRRLPPPESAVVVTTRAGVVARITRLARYAGKAGAPLPALTVANVPLSPAEMRTLKVWPAVLLPAGVTTATADAGADASKLGTVAAANGALQVTYGGKALYWFAKDKAAGQVHGNVSDKWGKWSTVTASGKSSPDSGKTNAGTGGTAF